MPGAWGHIVQAISSSDSDCLRVTMTAAGRVLLVEINSADAQLRSVGDCCETRLVRGKPWYNDLS